MSVNICSKLKGSLEFVYKLYIVVLCIMFIVRDVFVVSIPLVVFLAFFAFGYCVFDYDYSLALSAILPLLNHGIQTNFVIMIAIIFYLFKYGKNMKLTITHGLIVFLMIFELMHMVIEPFSVSEYIRYFVQYLYLALILGEARIGELLKKPVVVIKTFIFMAAFFMVDVGLVTLKYMDFSSIINSDFRFGTLEDFVVDKPTLFDNENMVALFAIIAINLLVVLMLKEKKSFVYRAILGLFFTFFGLLTSSKTFLILFLVSVVMYILYIARKSLGKAFMALILGGSIGFVLAQTLFSEAVARIFARFSMADISTGRTRLFTAYHEYISSSFSRSVFGIGLQDVVKKSGVFNSPHNGMQEVVLCWGYIGLVMVLAILILMLVDAKKYSNTKIQFCYYIPFLIYFIFIQTIQFVRLPAIFGLLIVLYIAMIAGGRNDEEHILDNGRHRGR